MVMISWPQRLFSDAINRLKGYLLPEKPIDENGIIGSMSTPDRCLLLAMARRRVFEPFEGHRGFQVLRSSRRRMESSWSVTKRAITKLNRWMTYNRLIARFRLWSAEIRLRLKGTSNHLPFGELVTRVDTLRAEWQQQAKTTYSGIEHRAKQIMVVYIRKGLEILLKDNTERWIIRRSSEMLNDPGIVSMNDIRRLERDERQRLIEAFYPYNNPSSKNVAKRLNLTINLSLGAIVATNLPITGPVIALVNMAKTLIRIGNRLNTISAIYGYHVSSPQALFRVSATILKSIDDWETNTEHQPLLPEILDELYRPPEPEDPDTFQTLMAAVIRKEAYIAIPWIGTISLGKINLDDYILDLMIRYLVQDYFDRKELVLSYGEETVQTALEQYVDIYREFRRVGWFPAMLSRMDTATDTRPLSLGRRLRSIIDIDPIYQQASDIMDEAVTRLYEEIQPLKGEHQKTAIKAGVERFLQSRNLI
jgi:hypothetical protein